MKLRLKVLLPAVAAVAALSFSSTCFAYGGGSNGGGDNDGTDYESRGNYDTTRTSGGRSCTVYRPSNLTSDHPIILWGNGTGASPSTYGSLLDHWASWGYVVLAANTSNPGTGREMLSCLDWAEDSSIAGSLDFSKVGTSGHSQGGGGAIMAGVDPRITTTAPIEGYTLGLGHDRDSHDEQSGPMLLLSGSADTLVNPALNHATVVRSANVPVFWAILDGASHFEPVGNGGDFRGITTAWFQYQLAEDPVAGVQFEGPGCGYCTDRSWDVTQKDI